MILDLKEFSDKKGLYLRIALCIFILIAYFPALSGVYLHWDDNVFISENALLNLSFFPALVKFFESFYHGDYLPLPLLSYWLEIKFFGYSPMAQHLTQLVLHMINTCLLFGLLEKFYAIRDPRFPKNPLLVSETPIENIIFVICFFFAVHPLQVESVAWISERKGLLSTLFLFLSIRAYLSIEDAPRDVFLKNNKKKILAYLGFYLISLLNKMTGVLLPVVLMAFEFVYFRWRMKKYFLAHFPLLFLGGVLSGVRVIAYSFSVPDLGSTTVNWERILTLPGMVLSELGYYIKNFVFPIDLSVLYLRYDNTPDQAWITSLPILTAAMIAYMTYLAGKRRQKQEFPLNSRLSKRAHAMFWATFSFLFLAPVLQFVPRVNFINDRYMYLPIIGFAAILAPFIGKKSQWVAYPLIFLAIPAVSFHRSKIWTDDISLWSDTVSRAPTSSIAHNNLGLGYMMKGDIVKAVPEFEAVLNFGKRDATDNLGYSNLGAIYSNPTNPPPYYNPDKGIEYFKEGIKACVKADDAFALRLNLAYAYMGQHRMMEAMQVLTLLEKDLEATVDQKYLQLLEKTRGFMTDIRRMSASSTASTNPSK